MYKIMKSIVFFQCLMASFQLFAAGAGSCSGAPVIEMPSGDVVSVSNEAELQSAIGNLQGGETIVLQPGRYVLSSTLYIQDSNITLTGPAGTCDSVELIGRGMENSSYGDVPHGIWANAPNLSIRNLTIRDVYYHAIALNKGAESPHIYNVQMLDAGEQFIKASSSSDGQYVDDGVVAFSTMEYTAGPPATDHGGGTGYTNGVDVHGGQNWVIKNNVFKSFHAPDASDNLWNPAVLMWRGAGNTLTENNVFIDCDRAIAYGLTGNAESYSHTGGIIRNNMIYYSPGLFSAWRTSRADAGILVWDSPGTKVYHNTALVNGNVPDFIQFRFRTDDAAARNNLSDAAIRSRGDAVFIEENNVLNADPGWFEDPAQGDLHLTASSESDVPKVERLSEVLQDFDLDERSSSTAVGADQYQSVALPLPPSGIDVEAQQ